MCMSEKMKEELSAMMDDESSMFGIRRVLAEIEGNHELNGSWQRYHVVRAALQQSSLCHTSMSDRVRATLENEPAATPDAFDSIPQGSAPERKQKMGQYAGSMAIAATVAFMTVFGWQQYQGFHNNGLNNGLGAPAAVLAQNDVSVPVTAISKDQKPLLDAGDALILSDMPRAGMQTASTGANSRSQKNLIRLPISSVDALALKKLNVFMSNHAEHAALNTSRGMLPLARTINYTTVDGAKQP